MKIEDYKLATGSSVEELESAVEKLLAHGWVPLGGPCINAGELVQAMVSSHESRVAAARARDY